MGEWGFFQKALTNFTHEAASGGAIRHLADRGYTVEQIAGMLDFPVPYREVQQAVWEHFVKKGVILLEEPGSVSRKEKAVYVREYDKFGKPSFRRVMEAETPRYGLVESWTKLQIDYRDIPGERLSALLLGEKEENGEEASYLSWDFGAAAKTSPETYRTMLLSLPERQRPYISGLPWEARRVYHRLDDRMAEILLCLCKAGQYQGECYFLKTQKMIRLK